MEAESSGYARIPVAMGAASHRTWPLPRVHRSAVHEPSISVRKCVGVLVRARRYGRCIPRDISACGSQAASNRRISCPIHPPCTWEPPMYRTVRPPDRLDWTLSMVVQSRWKVRHESEYAHPVCADSPGTADVATCALHVHAMPTSAANRRCLRGINQRLLSLRVLPQRPLSLNGLAEQLCDLFGPSWGEVNVV